MFGTMSLTDIIAFFSLILTAVSSLIGLIILLIKNSVKNIVQVNDEQQKKINENTTAIIEVDKKIDNKLLEIHNKYDEKIQTIENKFEGKVTNMSEKMAEFQEAFNKNLNNLHLDIIERLSQIIEQQAKLEKTILKEFVTEDMLDKQSKAILRELDQMPCKRNMSSKDCPGKNNLN
jgi:hypothetical protein